MLGVLRRGGALGSYAAFLTHLQFSPSFVDPTSYLPHLPFRFSQNSPSSIIVRSIFCFSELLLHHHSVWSLPHRAHPLYPLQLHHKAVSSTRSAFTPQHQTSKYSIKHQASIIKYHCNPNFILPSPKNVRSIPPSILRKQLCARKPVQRGALPREQQPQPSKPPPHPTPPQHLNPKQSLKLTQPAAEFPKPTIALLAATLPLALLPSRKHLHRLPRKFLPPPPQPPFPLAKPSLPLAKPPFTLAQSIPLSLFKPRPRRQQTPHEQQESHRRSSRRCGRRRVSRPRNRRRGTRNSRRDHSRRYWRTGIREKERTVNSPLHPPIILH